MVTLAVIQILYLVINAIGLVLGLLWIFGEIEYSAFYTFLTKIATKCGNFVLGIFSILFIALFIPAITVLAAVILFMVFIGADSDE